MHMHKRVRQTRTTFQRHSQQSRRAWIICVNNIALIVAFRVSDREYIRFAVVRSEGTGLNASSEHLVFMFWNRMFYFTHVKILRTNYVFPGTLSPRLFLFVLFLCFLVSKLSILSSSKVRSIDEYGW